MKIAILNISIGDYIVFWKDFYLSAKANFMTDCEKEFFVFTDKEEIYSKDAADVHTFFQENLGWPYNTMKRFNMFRRIMDNLSDFDYIFFANGNAEFVSPLTSDLIEKDTITVEHPGFHFTPIADAPFERNPKSRAYVKHGDEKTYVQGAFYGATFESFKKMVTELDDLTEADLKEGIIALWHDESFLNHYVCSHDDVQILGWQYLKYEEYVMPYKAVIQLRDKRKYLTNKNGRFLNENFLKKRILLFFRNVKWWVLIRLGLINK